jgi:prepilin peptidase CpaA
MSVPLVRLIAAALLIAAGASDARTQRIPNLIPMSVLLLFLCAAVTGAFHPLAPHVLVFLLTIVFGGLLFAAGHWGGGDAKLAAAMSLFFVPSELMRFLLVTALAGGVVAVVFLMRAECADRSRKMPMPYGIAIAVGGLDWCAFG